MPILISFILSIVVLAVSLLIVSKLPLGIEIDSPVVALVAGGIIGAFSGIWGFFPNWFRGFAFLISLGIIPLIGSIIVFGLAAWLVQGFRLRWGIGSAILGAIALAIVHSILVNLLGVLGLTVA